MTRPRRHEGTETDLLADEAGSRAMVDLMLGTTALMLVVLLAVGAQALRHRGSAAEPQPQTAEQLDALFAGADSTVIFAEASGIRLAGSDHVIAVGDIAGNPDLAAVERGAPPVLVIAPQGLEAAFHVTARLAVLGVREIKRVRLADGCAVIERVDYGAEGASVSCRRR